MTEIVYTTQQRGLEKGRIYENPRYFERVNPACTRAVVIGDWPKVVSAYQEAGVEVVFSFVGETLVHEPENPGGSTPNLVDLEKKSIQELRELVEAASPGRKILSKKEGVAFLEDHYGLKTEDPQDAAEPAVDGGEGSEGDNLL